MGGEGSGDVGIIVSDGMKEGGNRFKGSRSQGGFSVKEALFLKSASQGLFIDDDPMLIGELFYELLVGMGSETLFNSSRSGSKSIGGVSSYTEISNSEVCGCDISVVCNR